VDVQAARQAAHALFRLPAHLKGCPNCSVRNESVGLQRGYIPFAAESGLADVLEVKEGFSYGMDWPTGLKSMHPFQTTNPWPPPEGLAKLGPSWRSSMIHFFNDTIRVASEVVSSLAEVMRALDWSSSAEEAIPSHKCGCSTTCRRHRQHTRGVWEVARTPTGML